MATAATIKKNIAKLEAALKSKATPKSLKPKLETQLVKSKAELSGMNKGTKPKTSSTKSTQTALQKLKAMVNKNKKYKTYKGAGVDLEKDADRPALRTGRRIAKESGKTYYEYRANRIDVKQPPKRYPKLEKGGRVDDFSDKIQEGDIVWDSGNNSYGVVLNTYDFKYGEIRLDSDGNQPEENLHKLGSKGDKGTKEKLKAALLAHKSLITKYPEMGYEKVNYAKGGMSQGYDDREDERLGMEHGKMSTKDLHSTHARRDDARFEERMAKGGSIRTLYKQFNQEKPNILLIMIADDVASDFMREKFDKTVDWSKLSDSEKEKYNEDYRVNKTSFENYLMSEFVKLYYSDDSIKEKCKGSSHKTIDSIKSVMKDLAKKYPQDKYAKGGEFKPYGKTKGNFKIEYVEDGEKQSEIWESKEMVEDRGKKLLKLGCTEIKITEMAKGGYYAEGGISEKEVVESNAEMVLSKIKEVKHHAMELSNVVSKNSDIEAWVVAKIERASTDLSDITHYLEFQTKKMAMGGEIHRTQD